MNKRFFIDFTFLALFLILLGTIVFGAEEAAGIIRLDSQRELFIDHHLIERMDQTRLVLHAPREEGIAFKFDQRWEGAFCGYCTIIKDGDIFRAYYRGLPDAAKDSSRVETTCCAESRDGIHWEKPELSFYTVYGVSKNNVILADAAPVTHNFSPFLDTRPGVPAAQRYKALGGTGKSGLIAYVSPDGLQWTRLQEEAVFTDGLFDSQNVSFWSTSENCYICYFRTWTRDGYNGFRSVSRTTSEDFVHWTKAEQMNFGNRPLEHIYTNQTHPYFRAPHIYLSIAARFMPNRQVLTDEQAKQLDVNPKYFKDCSDAVFMTSRGGNLYDRTFMSSFIRPGIGPQNWVSRSNYPALNVVQTSPVELSIYVNQDYAQPTAHLRRYSLRLDGFASVSAAYEGGEVLTKLLIFRGEKLVLNFATSAAGEIKVEIQNENGQPIPGFSFNDANPQIGNEIERVVTWKKGSDVSAFAGKPVRLRFVMKDADLYALRFK